MLNPSNLMLWLQNTPIAVAVRETDIGFPALESIHVLFLTTVFGSIILLDLRLTGIAFQDRKISDVTKDVMSWLWCSFAGAALSGSLLFASAAVKYYEDWATRGKFICMGLAGINMLVYEFATHPTIANWDNDKLPPARVRLAGFLSMALWIGVIIFGRWIGYSTQDQDSG